MLSERDKPLEGKVNYYVLIAAGLLVLLFVIANSFEPQIDNQIDLFELTYLISSAAPVILCFIIAKRYWGSKMFGKAYLALGIAFLMGHIGDEIFQYFQLAGISNPYPYYSDIFFVSFFPFAFYHLYRNIRLFKPRLEIKEKIMIIIIPSTITLMYALALLVPVSIPDGVPELVSKVVWVEDKAFKLVPADANDSRYDSYQHITVDDTTYYLIPLNLTNSVGYEQQYGGNVTLNLVPVVISNFTLDKMPHYDQTFWNGFYMGVYYSATTTTLLSWNVIGVRTFRGTVLGNPWGLLVTGMAIGTVANVIYYYTSIFSYDRTSPILGLWILGNWIVCYALYLHRKQL